MDIDKTPQEDPRQILRDEVKYLLGGINILESELKNLKFSLGVITETLSKISSIGVK
jgi:hypothetical protein